jgi:hypothetical protein
MILESFLYQLSASPGHKPTALPILSQPETYRSNLVRLINLRETDYTDDPAFVQQSVMHFCAFLSPPDSLLYEVLSVQH